MDAPPVVAQIIETSWTKQARGGALAELRSRVPECVPLPMWQPEPRSVCVTHHVRYDSRNDFATSTSEHVEHHRLFPLLLCDCVELQSEDSLLHVVFAGMYTSDSEPGTLFGYRGMGSPGRTIPHKPFILDAGSWGQIRYYGRFVIGHQGYTVYKKYTYNIAWQMTPEPQMFLATQPQHRFASLPRLW